MPLQNDLTNRSGLAQTILKPGTASFGALLKAKEDEATSGPDSGTTGSSSVAATAASMMTAKTKEHLA